MCTMLHELQESVSRIHLALDESFEKEMRDLNNLSSFIKDLYLNKHHNDELMDMEEKHVS